LVYYDATLVDKRSKEIIRTQFPDIYKNLSKFLWIVFIECLNLGVTAYTICCNFKPFAFCSRTVSLFFISFSVLKIKSNYLSMISFSHNISPLCYIIKTNTTITPSVQYYSVFSTLYSMAVTCFGQSAYNSENCRADSAVIVFHRIRYGMVFN
jgi:hypothetical protein